jgi:FecR protein
MKIAAAVLCLSIIATSVAAAPIGSVSENKGDACTVERGKTKLPGAKGASIESMDTYSTGACASSITFQDNSKVKVTENSRLVIDEFVYDPKSTDAGKMAMKVTMGTVRFASGQIEKNNSQNVAVSTPTATIAVRGTDFTMTVDEAGQSLVVLLPSCNDPKMIKTYEMETNRCKVGRIDVSTSAGTVTLENAFEGTYVLSSQLPPTAPVVINTVESKINNTLILLHPPEIDRAIRDTTGKTKRDQQEAELEAEAQRLASKAREDAATAEAEFIRSLQHAYTPVCDPIHGICVKWDNENVDSMQAKGKGTAYRMTPNEHYAEVKTEGYTSNTNITITQNDSVATYLIGDGSPGGNTVYIKQNTGVLIRKP